ncbi:hypothetical protein SAMN05421821_10790 [Mucilaginibacter lappiensis]|uniref:Uncharacterized protein n=1 Tax=Mucilaginibacter lappiensis TaxID=354630 RepID=A0ABR6PLC0_9SPHI|nr:hypothetical protein [Mucilaginibacter lappiensis]SIR41663.1 hypothetical protein SAMN05421821_10790 [Mucilaginibacter lappiensis]
MQRLKFSKLRLKSENTVKKCGLKGWKEDPKLIYVIVFAGYLIIVDHIPGIFLYRYGRK